MELDRIYNMDCLEGMKQLPDECIDLTVTSPPYDNLRTYNGYCFDFENIAKELFRVTKQGGVVVWVVGDAVENGSETCSSFRQAIGFVDVGFKLHDTMIYKKHNPTPNTGNGIRYQQCYEYMFVLSKGQPKTTNLITEPRHNECNDPRTFRVKKTNRDAEGNFDEGHYVPIKEEVPKQNIWSYKVGLYNSTSDKVAFDHPAIFPEQLAADHIRSWSNEGDIILDPFMGSGTTAKVARALGRHYIGYEISAEYCDIIRKRLEQTRSLFDL